VRTSRDVGVEVYFINQAYFLKTLNIGSDHKDLV